MGISTTEYRDIMYQYDQARMKNRHLAEQRLEEISQKIPEIQDIQTRLIQLSVMQARTSLLEPETADESDADYQRELQQLIQKKQQLLESHGYPADYLAPIYTCPDCKDTGYIEGKPCQCLLRAQSELLYRNSNLADVLAAENFGTFRPEYYDDEVRDDNLSLTPRENILKLREVCMDYISRFDDAYDNLIFYGPTGVGKTFLTNCIAKELLDSGHSVVYLTSLQLFDILEKSKFGKDGEAASSGKQIAWLLSNDLLIIDDLGTELTNSFTISQLYYLIEERHLAGRSSIFSTNLSFQELHDRYGERIFSRFTGYYNFCKIIGKDIRPIKRFQ